MAEKVNTNVAGINSKLRKFLENFGIYGNFGKEKNESGCYAVPFRINLFLSGSNKGGCLITFFNFISPKLGLTIFVSEILPGIEKCNKRPFLI